VALVVFNMLPAFPMDGGRVLRALLATFLKYGQATRIAARVGQVCALGLGLLGLVNPFLFVIAAFVFLGAAAEARQVTVRERLEGFRVGDAMIRTFRAVSAKTPIRLLAARMLDSPQRDYPVIDGSTYAGMLRRDEVLAALSRRGDSLAEDVMMSNVPPIEETDPLVSVLDATGTHRLETLPVTNGGMLTGLLDVQQMHELVQARANLERMSSAWDVTSDRRVDPNLN
jgi:CBS domain-containing protein